LHSSGQDGTGQVLYRAENGKIIFESDAPLEFITARSQALKGLIDPVKNTFAFQVETRSLKGFNSPLQQEHFYENYMESDEFPLATFKGKIIEPVDYKKPGTLTIRAKGILDIHGRQDERIITCTLQIEGEELKATSTFYVNLDDHDIAIPKLVNQKIAESIKVMVDINFVKSIRKE
jgi:polyisoprenoid-binding protein YceI